jgi:hypothetical protein
MGSSGGICGKDSAEAGSEGEHGRIADAAQILRQEHTEFSI